MASSALTTVLSLRGGSASGTLARFELLAQVGKLGGALKTSHVTPAASTTSERSASTGPSVDGAGRASTVTVAERPHARRPSSGPRASASASSAGRLEVDESRKRDAQTGGPRGALESASHAGSFFSRVGEGSPVFLG